MNVRDVDTTAVPACSAEVGVDGRAPGACGAAAGVEDLGREFLYLLRVLPTGRPQHGEQVLLDSQDSQAHLGVLCPALTHQLGCF